MLVETAAVSLDHFTHGILHVLSSISLVVGIILLVLGIDRFKKRSDSSQQSTLSLAMLYAVFGLGLIILYFATLHH